MIKIKLNSALREAKSSSGGPALLFREANGCYQFILVDPSAFNSFIKNLKKEKGVTAPTPRLSTLGLKFDQFYEMNLEYPMVLSYIQICKRRISNCFNALEVKEFVKHPEAFRGAGNTLYKCAMSYIGQTLGKPVMADRSNVSPDASRVYSHFDSDPNITHVFDKNGKPLEGEREGDPFTKEFDNDVEKLGALDIGGVYTIPDIDNCTSPDIGDSGSNFGDPVNKAYFSTKYFGLFTQYENNSSKFDKIIVGGSKNPEFNRIVFETGHKMFTQFYDPSNL